MNYTSLDPSSSQTRLLRLLPQPLASGPAEPWHHCVGIQCTFETVALASAPAYEALSYTWGDDDPTVQVWINGKTCWVRSNLACALAALRTTEPRLLWVDALCINQDNIHERNHQVRLMGEIYRRARQVLVWLGRPNPQWGSLVAGALRMAERLRRVHPKSILSAPPPQPHIHHEPNFDHWIDSEMRYIVSRKANSRSTSVDEAASAFENELKKWRDMKARREWNRQARERLPEMTREVQEAGPSLAPKQNELDQLRILALQEQDFLSDLRARELQQQNLLEEGPILRRLLAFRERQRQAIQDADVMSHAKQLGAANYLEKRRRGRNEKHSSTGQNDEGPQRAESLYWEINLEFARFQHSVNDLRIYFGKKLARMTVLRRKRWTDVLSQLHEKDMEQRRHLRALQHQLAEWQLPEDEAEAHRHLSQLFRSQDSALERQIKIWKSSQDSTLETFGSVSKLMSQQQALVHNLVRSQCEELERLQDKEENWREKSPSFVVDPFLATAEVDMLKEARKRRWARLRQCLVVQHVELRRSEIEAFFRRHDAWQREVYSMSSNLRSDASLEKASVVRQTGWVELWHSIREQETATWEETVFERGGSQEQFVYADLLSLENICYLPYWRRLWIVQEVLLAEKLTLCFGDNARTTKNWDILAMARDCLEKLPNTWELSPGISVSIDRIKHAIPFELDALREDRAQLWPLPTLIGITESSLCQDPRDKVYGLLGLVRGFENEDFDISYEKPLEEVYCDAIQWYHSKHAEQHDSCSLVRLSQILQLSLRGHCEAKSVGGIPTLPSLDKSVLSRLTGQFRVKGTIGGAVFPLEKLLGDSELMGCAQRDWIGTLAEYSHCARSQRPKHAVEKELVFLDSIIVSPVRASFTMHDQAAQSSSQAKNQREAQFFITSDGMFGISSASIRENDLLCEFQDSHLGLLLRVEGDSHNLVGEAILSSIVSDNKMRGTRLEQPGAHPVVRPFGDRPFMDVTLDIASLQGLTAPLNLRRKHVNRVPLDIQEASFGWHEFITLGLDVPPRPLRLKQSDKGNIEPQEAEQQDLMQADVEEVISTAEPLPENWTRSIVDRWKEMTSGITVNLETSDKYLQFDVPQLPSSPPTVVTASSFPTPTQSSVGLPEAFSQADSTLINPRNDEKVASTSTVWRRAKRWAALRRWLKV